MNDSRGRNAAATTATATADASAAATAAATGSAGKGLRRDAAENRARLLRAAWEAFAEQGPDAGVEEIARRAGVGMGTLYRRFPTKDALINELSEVIFESILEHARMSAALGADRAPGQPSGLEESLFHMGEVMAGHHGCLSRLWQASPPPDQDERRTELWQLMDRMLDQAKASGDVRPEVTLTDVYLSVIALRSLVDDTAGQAPDLWRRYLEVVLAGFRPAPGARPLAYQPADDSLVRHGLPKRRH
ncbi:TetR/AcrR family transcriptional regulator [Streptacidiphilus anmyonensis]|uniref:TetR/AcrR family transcriptional regulator n=1 Tax=Streptacidiphilus anmyonensis TaxID=405782 RepID=UPI000694D743|nr:TetR/AcrR family transcriptional regulator [Streptacidiphilus anmyonensis]